MGRRRATSPAAQPNVDMSPMIDLVFLLLIFFMIVSTVITYQKDDRVRIPVALDSEVPNLVKNRIVVNILQDGKVFDEYGKPLTLQELEQIMAQAKGKNPNTKLHLRADARVSHDKVKDVVNASAKGGVADVIFSTYVVN